MAQVVQLILENLSNPIFSASISGLITFLLMYLEAKMSGKEIQRKTYTKNILLVMILVGSIVYILSNYNMNQSLTKVIEETKKTIGGTENLLEKINYDASDIFMGEPKF
jgi:hypothetical protein